METIRERIGRIYCETSRTWYNNYCRIVDALTDEELTKVCEYIAEFCLDYSDADIANLLGFADDVAEIIGIEEYELEKRAEL